MKKVAISIGDLNGIGPHIVLLEHHRIRKFCDPIYCVHKEILENVARILKISIPENLEVSPPLTPIVEIKPGKITSESGRYSYESFLHACNLAINKEVYSITTLPIHKKAWNLAGINEAGHTQVLSKMFKTQAIMVLGCEQMFIALFSDHIPLKEVSDKIKQKNLIFFLKKLHECVKISKVLVLGINPHCGDDGVIGREDEEIKKAIRKVNSSLGKEIFIGPIPADSAFSPSNRKKYQFFVSMYHDVGLAVLKALFFEESINITFNIPILRTSVDHGTAYDIAYKKRPNTKSYINAVKFAIKKWSK